MTARSAGPSFRRLLAGPKGINYLNTVVVWIENWTYWLGYIQDIWEEYVYVDFDCSTVGACWIHSSCVWPLQYWQDSPGYSFRNYRSTPIFVALRDEPGGPLRFRSAVAVWDSDRECGKTYIRAEIVEEGSESPVAGGVEVVDHWQAISRLPFDEPSLLGRTEGLLYIKHVIPLTRAQLAVNTAADAARLIQELLDAYRTQASVHLLNADLRKLCRFHLRIGEDGCTVMIIANRTDSDATERTQQMLLRILENHASATGHPPAMAHISDSTGMPCAVQLGMESDTVDQTAALSHLPPEISLAILTGLDVHSQANAKRVCGLWQRILSDPCSGEHLTVLVENVEATESDDHRCYHTAWMLIRTITAATRSVAIVARQDNPHSKGIDNLGI
ncbi:uncharacterized protein LOC129602306 [Paramacrobiotus metropolitanus]|uniref:uncharacterized protein LOC129602306 n=1 Tax=Paramacrobiotus metropolitanus TaxID=2943436 RepID=UPI00244585CD|nr:uncharacterized protein LOC129602306 [Paramacrobiotus metropolitanus]